MASLSQHSGTRLHNNLYGDSVHLEIAKLNWFGHKKHSQPAQLDQFGVHSLEITTLFKLKLNQPLLVNLECEHYRLKDIPAVVTHNEPTDKQSQQYHYSLKFTFGTLNEPARNIAYTVLKLIEDHLIATTQVA